MLPFAAVAQAPKAPDAAELRFDIARYRVEGNTLLPADEVERAVQPFAGRQRSFGDVKRALEALENAYRGRGYSAVQVFLPEQDLDKGEVLLRVIEARIRRLEVQGNKHFSDDNVRASLVALAEGTSPNASAVSKNLAIVNESPAKRTDVTLRAGEKDGDVEALVEVADENPKKYFITLDNTGTGQTGYHRLGFGYQHANLNGRDAALTLQYVTSPEKLKDVGIYSIGYHLPLYAAGGSMDFVAGYSDVNAGTTQTPSGALAFSGRGGVLGARFNQHLDRIAGYDHKLVWALDHRMYRNTCTLGAFGAAGCGTAGATFSLTPLSLTYAGTLLGEAAQTTFSAALSANAGGGSHGNTDAIGRARFAAKSRYQVLRFSAGHARALEGDWQLRARLEAQHTDEVLVSPEQFGIGGANSVRGFLERERADDRGHSGSLEVSTPDMGARLDWKDLSLRLLAFYDFGRTSKVNPQPGEQVHSGVASVGLGIRLAQQKAFSLRFDLANIRDPEGTRVRDHWRFALGAVVSF
ncbi:MAG: ShlB/FhaC/HecB family hemolysin secretion/activation protein [Betaproteobacteria bacterium]|nr:ShlB/FhaC/HecB family hemolysin secretion/activation protein [Betaproteobacteria bacterium]